MVCWSVGFLRCGWFGIVVFNCWDAIEVLEANVRVRHCDITPFGKLLLHLGDIAGRRRRFPSMHIYVLRGDFLNLETDMQLISVLQQPLKGHISVGPLWIMA